MSAREPCRPELLEPLLDGEVADHEAAQLALHLATCEHCAEELAWLRTERQLFAERRRSAERVPVSLWLGVQEKLQARATPVVRWFTPRARWLELGAAFACLVALMVPTVLTAPVGSRPMLEATPIGMCLVGDANEASGGGEDGPACHLQASATLAWSVP